MTKALEPFCFWCGGNPSFEFSTEPRPFYEDRQALCESCSAMSRGGILLFELTETDPGCGNPTMHNGAVFYTGRWVVIDDHTAARVFPPEMLGGVINTRIAELRADNFARGGFDKYPWRTIQ